MELTHPHGLRVRQSYGRPRARTSLSGQEMKAWPALASNEIELWERRHVCAVLARAVDNGLAIVTDARTIATQACAQARLACPMERLLHARVVAADDLPCS